MRIIIRWLIITSAIFLFSSTPIVAASEPTIACPAFFTAGNFVIYKCIDPDDDKLIYSNSVGFISQCTDY